MLRAWKLSRPWSILCGLLKQNTPEQLMIKGWLLDFGLAWRLLTIIPLPLVPMETGRPAGRSAGYYPLVGLILGLLLAYLDQFWAWLLPPGLASALLLVVWVALTGLLHLDGFMDA